MKKLLLLAAAGLIMQATPVLADHHGDKGGKGGKMLEKHDTNGDGVISEAEFMNSAKEKFSTMDKDGDGSITKEEGKAAREAKREKRKEMKEKWKEKRQEKRQEKRDSKAAE